jgi:hypothetical protein
MLQQSRGARKLATTAALCAFTSRPPSHPRSLVLAVTAQSLTKKKPSARSAALLPRSRSCIFSVWSRRPGRASAHPWRLCKQKCVCAGAPCCASPGAGPVRPLSENSHPLRTRGAVRFTHDPAPPARCGSLPRLRAHTIPPTVRPTDGETFRMWAMPNRTERGIQLHQGVADR